MITVTGEGYTIITVTGHHHDHCYRGGVHYHDHLQAEGFTIITVTGEGYTIIITVTGEGTLTSQLQGRGTLS